MKKNIPVLTIKSPSVDSIHYVVYLLHGFGGSSKSWLDLEKNLLKKSKTEKVLFVAPDGGRNSYYLDAKTKEDVQYETFVGEELPAYVRSNYLLKSDYKKGILGHSMGGYGAFRLALLSGDFDFAGAVSGVMDLTESSKKKEIASLLTNDSIYDESLLEAISIKSYINQETKQKTYYAFVCGRRDYLVKGNRALAKLFEQAGYRFRYKQTRYGRHTYRYFKRQFPKLLDQLVID